LDVSEEQVLKWFALFNTINTDGDNVISIEEFFAYYKIPCTPIIKRSFKIMPRSIATDHDARTREDVKGMGVSFATFFVTLHEFCTMTKKEHLKFCFNLFDLDRSGKLTQSEIEKMIKLVTGKEDTAQAKSIVAAADKGSLKGGAADGQVDFDEFAKAVKKFKKFTAPLWDEQMKLREKTFGKKYWSARQTYKRAYGKANGLSDSVDLIELFHRERQMAAKKTKRVYRDPTRDKEAFAKLACSPPPDPGRRSLLLFQNEKQAGEAEELRKELARREREKKKSQEKAADDAAAAATSAKVAPDPAWQRDGQGPGGEERKDDGVAFLRDEGGWVAAANEGETALEGTMDDGTNADPSEIRTMRTLGGTEWIEYEDTVTGGAYYYNTFSQLSSWNRPDNAVVWTNPATSPTFKHRRGPSGGGDVTSDEIAPFSIHDTVAPIEPTSAASSWVGQKGHR